MTELRESLSAMMDGEASEIEVHRILRQMSDDPSLRETWLAWHQVRGTIARQPGDIGLPVVSHMELHQRISAAVASENLAGETAGTPTMSASQGIARYRRPAAAMAMAASLVVAVLVGVQIGRTGDTAAPASVATATQGIPSAPIAVQTVANPASVAGAMDSGNLRELDEEGQRRLRAYLNQHDRLARDTRLVTYPQNPAK